MKPLKLFYTFDDLEFKPVEVDVEDFEGVLEEIELAEVEIRNGKTIRVTLDEEEGETTYMAVLFEGTYVDKYCIADTKEELTKWMIEIQKGK